MPSSGSGASRSFSVTSLHHLPLVVLLLVALSFDARAGVSCPSGRAPTFKIVTLDNATVSGYTGGNIPGAVGDEISKAEAQSAVSSVVQNGVGCAQGGFYAWNRVSTGTAYDPYSYSHHYIWGADGATGTREAWSFGGTCSNNPNHNPTGGYAGMAIVEGCGDPPTCDAPAGASLDLADPLNTPNGAALCIENCAVTAFVGLGITKKGSSQSGTIAFGIVNDPPTACTENSEAEPSRPRTCYQEDELTVCAYSDEPDQIGDGAIDQPDPAPDVESAVDKDDLDDADGGCVTLPSGAAFCVVGAPDAPDNGNPGQPATPDAVVQGGNGFAGNTTYNYYSSSTVSSSSNHGDGTGNGECDPSKTNCDGEGDPNGECDPVSDPQCREDGKGTISGGNNCSAPPVCNNDPIQCYHSTRLWELKCALATPTSDSLSTAISAGAADGLKKQDGSPLVDQIGDDLDLSSWWTPPSASNACPTDIVIHHFLGTAVLPVSDWCSILHAVGFFVLIGAALASFRIFAQGFV